LYRLRIRHLDITVDASDGVPRFSYRGGSGLTMIVSEPVTLSTVARICAEPGDADITRPLADTLAMVRSDEIHRAALV
jgi:hypothetical protein